MAGKQKQPNSEYIEMLGAFRLVEFLASQFSRTIVVFFRFDFGERYFNLSDLPGAAFSFLIYAGAIIFFLGFSKSGEAAEPIAGTAESSGYVLAGFFLCFLLMSVYHQLLSRIQKLGGRQFWHSRYSGTSYLRVLTALPFISGFVVQRYIEPFLAIITGFIFLSFAPALGLWLVFGGMCLGFTEAIAYRRSYLRVLDAIDSQIEARFIGDALSGTKTAQETKGFVLPVPSNFKPAQREQLATAMRELDPALVAIMDAPGMETAAIDEKPDDPDADAIAWHYGSPPPSPHRDPFSR